jgi:hypothetical protein
MDFDDEAAVAALRTCVKTGTDGRADFEIANAGKTQLCEYGRH